MTITTGIRDSNADVGQKYVTTEYLIENYPHLIPSRLNSNLFGLGQSTYFGSFGNNTSGVGRYSYPTQMARGGSGNGTGWTKISTVEGAESFFAMKNDGSLWSWGYNTAGILGINSNNANRSTPTQIGTGYAYLPAGALNFMAAIKADGTLWTWGTNSNGQLGHNNVTARSTPTQVGTDTNWAKVAVGYYHMLAIKKDGTLWSWGGGFNGSLGLGFSGPPIFRSSPVQVGVATNWKEISAGNATSYAIDTSGAMWVWGTNGFGQLGSGDTTALYSPTSPATWAANAPWKKVFAKTNVFAISTTNSLYGSGTNSSYDLGVGDANNRSTPTQIGPANVWMTADSSFTSIYYNVSGGIRIDGTLWLWGSDGQPSFGVATLGTLGGAESRSVPTQVGTSGQWRSLAIGNTAVAGIHDGDDLSNALPVTSSIDNLQYWQNVTGSRALGTTYTNNTGKPIQITVGAQTIGSGGGVFITVDGVTLPAIFAYSGAVGTMSAPVVIPPGSTYSASAYGTVTYTNWFELVFDATTTNGLGYSQSWTDVTASRTFSNTYTNSTGKPIQVIVGAQTSGLGGGVYFIVDGLSLPPTWTHSGAVGTTSAAVIVPAGSTYSATSYGSVSYASWYELRGSVSSGGKGIGYIDSGYGWRSLSGRNFGVTYINGSPDPIQVIVSGSTAGSGGGVIITINGVSLPSYFAYSSSVTVTSGAFIVPSGARYSAYAYGGISFAEWMELVTR